MLCCGCLGALAGKVFGGGTAQQQVYNINVPQPTQVNIIKPNPGYNPDHQYPPTPAPYRGQQPYNHDNGMTTARY